MELSQIFYAALLTGAIWWGRPDWRLSLICVSNFLGTMTLAASPIAVGVLDMATIAALIFIATPRAFALAAVFAALVPIYPVGAFLTLPAFAIYAIVDLLGYAIPGILSGGSGGRSARSKFDRGGRARLSVVAPFGSHAQQDMGRNS